MDLTSTLLYSTLTAPILNVLALLYRVCGDIGVSIVLLTGFCFLLLSPLIFRQVVQAQTIQALQPQIQELRQRYAHEREKRTRALQELYKQHRVGVLVECLPLLIQMAILYGLRNAFTTILSSTSLSAINAHLYSFIPLFQHVPDLNLNWFTWLSVLNPLLHVHLSWSIPLNSPDPTHLLPILAGVATSMQMRTMQLRGLSDTQQKNSLPQKRILSLVLPPLTALLSWYVAAGLALSWVCLTVCQVILQAGVTRWRAFSHH